MSVWQDISTAPKDANELVVCGGELWDNLGSPTFGGMYVVYWTDKIEEFPEGAWSIKAGLHTMKYGGYAIVHEPTHWMIPE